MIEFNLTPIRELIDFLKYIEEVGKTRKLKNLHKLYFRILCLLREIQDSIKDSVHELLCDRIAFYGLEDYQIG